MDLGILTVPLTMIGLAFGFAVVTDTQTVHIDKITLSSAVGGGYTPDVFVNQLVDEMHTIEHEAQSKATARGIELSGHKGALIVLADYMKVTPLIRVAQESAGLIPFSFAGEVVAAGPTLEMTLRGHGATAKPVRIVTHAPLDQVPELIKSTAYEAMRVIDPYILAAYQFKRDFRIRDFTPTLGIIEREMAAPAPANVKWMNNLAGIILYQQADRAGAIERFKNALAVDPHFAAPALNWGVVLARQGHNEEAIEKYRAVVSDPWGDASAATMAAAYAEWGFSLALLGRTDEAFAKFHQATQADPQFSEVYTSWAEVLSALGRGAEADAMSRKALELAPTEVIYTETLIGPVQHLPATASVVN